MFVTISHSYVNIFQYKYYCITISNNNKMFFSIGTICRFKSTTKRFMHAHVHVCVNWAYNLSEFGG